MSKQPKSNQIPKETKVNEPTFPPLGDGLKAYIKNPDTADLSSNAAIETYTKTWKDEDKNLFYAIGICYKFNKIGSDQHQQRSFLLELARGENNHLIKILDYARCLKLHADHKANQEIQTLLHDLFNTIISILSKIKELGFYDFLNDELQNKKQKFTVARKELTEQISVIKILLGTETDARSTAIKHNESSSSISLAETPSPGVSTAEFKAISTSTTTNQSTPTATTCTSGNAANETLIYQGWLGALQDLEKLYPEEKDDKSDETTALQLQSIVNVLYVAYTESVAHFFNRNAGNFHAAVEKFNQRNLHLNETSKAVTTTTPILVAEIKGSEQETNSYYAKLRKKVKTKVNKLSSEKGASAKDIKLTSDAQKRSIDDVFTFLIQVQEKNIKQGTATATDFFYIVITKFKELLLTQSALQSSSQAGAGSSEAKQDDAYKIINTFLQNEHVVDFTKQVSKKGKTTNTTTLEMVNKAFGTLSSDIQAKYPQKVVLPATDNGKTHPLTQKANSIKQKTDELITRKKMIDEKHTTQLTTDLSTRQIEVENARRGCEGEENVKIVIKVPNEIDRPYPYTPNLSSTGTDQKTEEVPLDEEVITTITNARQTEHSTAEIIITKNNQIYFKSTLNLSTKECTPMSLNDFANNQLKDEKGTKYSQSDRNQFQGYYQQALKTTNEAVEKILKHLPGSRKHSQQVIPHVGTGTLEFQDLARNEKLTQLETILNNIYTKAQYSKIETKKSEAFKVKGWAAHNYITLNGINYKLPRGIVQIMHLLEGKQWVKYAEGPERVRDGEDEITIKKISIDPATINDAAIEGFFSLINETSKTRKTKPSGWVRFSNREYWGRHEETITFYDEMFKKSSPHVQKSKTTNSKPVVAPGGANTNNSSPKPQTSARKRPTSSKAKSNIDRTSTDQKTERVLHSENSNNKQTQPSAAAPSEPANNSARQPSSRNPATTTTGIKSVSFRVPQGTSGVTNNKKGQQPANVNTTQSRKSYSGLGTGAATFKSNPTMPRQLSFSVKKKTTENAADVRAEQPRAQGPS